MEDNAADGEFGDQARRCVAKTPEAATNDLAKSRAAWSNVWHKIDAGTLLKACTDTPYIESNKECNNSIRNYIKVLDVVGVEGCKASVESDHV